MGKAEVEDYQQAIDEAAARVKALKHHIFLLRLEVRERYGIVLDDPCDSGELD